MNVDDLRRSTDDLPGEMPVLLIDPETGELIEPEFNVEAVREDLRYIAHTENGEPSLEALVIS